MKIAIRSFALTALALSSLVACKYETTIVVDQAEVSVIVIQPEAGPAPTDSATADSTPTSDGSLDVTPEASPDVVVVEAAAEAAPDTSVSTTVWSFCNPYSDPATSAANGWYGGCCVTGGSFKSATVIVPTQLFKGSGERVYYFAANGKRYDFPTTAILTSWIGPWDADHVPHSDPTICSSVVQITDAQLASIVIAGNITMRPGTYVTGIETDPKRYAVAKGGILRKIKDETVGTAVFGPSYTSRIVMTPDFAFVNFLMGVDVDEAYDPAVEFATTIEANLAAAAAATPTP